MALYSDESLGLTSPVEDAMTSIGTIGKGILDKRKDKKKQKAIEAQSQEGSLDQSVMPLPKKSQPVQQQGPLLQPDMSAYPQPVMQPQYSAYNVGIPNAPMSPQNQMAQNQWLQTMQPQQGMPTPHSQQAGFFGDIWQGAKNIWNSGNRNAQPWQERQARALGMYG